MISRAVFRAVCALICLGASMFLGSSISLQQTQAAEPTLAQLLQAFQENTGARIVFVRDDLPEGRYHDVLKPLEPSRREKAVEICIDEAKCYPRGYFGRVGLTTIGVFEACASRTTSDPSRPFDRQLGGYRYFGVYNKRDAIAAAFYSEGQLGLTFHHEIFHHVDSTVAGDTAQWQLSGDDARYQAAISGRRPSFAPPVVSNDLALLREKCIGYTLHDSVSAYAEKNFREDQAETARHLMTMLPNSLVQSIERPQLAGSQRILHVLGEYEKSVPDGPDFDWFVDVALQRTPEEQPAVAADVLIERLREYSTGGETHLSEHAEAVRRLLKDIVGAKPSGLTQHQTKELLTLSADVTAGLMRGRIQPDQGERSFAIWGSEDATGANYTLRHDLITFSRDVKRLAWIVDIHQTDASRSSSDATVSAIRANLRLLARYRNFVEREFSLSPGTAEVFDTARSMMLNAFPDPATRSLWKSATWDQTAKMPD